MEFGLIIIVVALFVYLFTAKAMKRDTKNCELNIEVSFKGLKLHFSAKEKNAPSNRKR